MSTSRRWQGFHIFCIVFIFLILTLSHYHEYLIGVPVADKICILLPLGLLRHAIERLVYPLLVVYAGWILGANAGCATWLASALAMLPRALIISPYPRDALIESIAALIIGGLGIVLIQIYRRSQQQQVALKASQIRYQDIFTNASDAIWVHDLKGNITIANNACEKLTGYALNELIGKNIAELSSPKILSLSREVKGKLMKDATIDERYEQHIIRKDKTEATVELATRLIKTGGEPVAFQHIARDVSEERRLRDILRVQIHKNLIAQEEERKRIARELHDDIAQSILLVSRRLDILISGTGRRLSKVILDELHSICSVVDNIYRSLQRYARDLRPNILDQMGLAAALNWLIDELSSEMGIKATLQAGTLPPVRSETELVMFRIVQEALSNIRKHAEASEVSVILESDADSIKMIIIDNGKGFDVSSLTGDMVSGGKLGILGMQERARLIGADIEIKSEPGRGTTIMVIVMV